MIITYNSYFVNRLCLLYSETCKGFPEMITYSVQQLIFLCNFTSCPTKNDTSALA